MGDKVLIYHNRCNGPAFWYAHPPVAGEVILRRNVKLLDGTTPKEKDWMLCGNCGEILKDASWLAPAQVYHMDNDEDMEKLYAPYKG